MKPLRHSPPSGGQFSQKEHDIKPVDSDVRPSGKFFGSIMQAPRNISYVVVSADILKVDKSWLNEVAPLNMRSIEVTEEVSKFDRPWLKELALLNMLNMEVTEEVFHLDRF